MEEVKAKLIRPIIDVYDWIQDKFYVGPEAEFIRPYVKDFITEYSNATYINEMGIRVPKRKFICTGASRTGKSYGVRILLQRILYEMSCYENFPCLFKLSPSTTPKIYWVSYTIGKSESTGLKQLIKMIDKVPYWQIPSLKRKPVESELKFPFCEVLSGSNVSHIIGEDMIGCVLDEANVRKVAQGTEVQEAQKMFKEMRQRSVMTFSRNGIWGGFSGIISSSTTSSSFVALELEKAKKDNDTVIMEASVYEANPEQYSKETFDVFIGNGEIEPFIVDSVDAVTTNLINEEYGLTVSDFIKTNQDLIEKVPVSIRKFYEEDLEFSLANMSGKVQKGNGTFMKTKVVDKMWDRTKKNPFYIDIPNIGIYDTTSPSDIWKVDIAMADYHGENAYIHVDCSQKHDKTGFSCLYYNMETNKICSLLTISMFMNKEIHDNQIDQEKILQLILYMKDMGVNIKYFTSDHYGKDWLVPQMKKIFGNDHSEYYSVDTNASAYLTMLNFAKIGRYALPYYKQLDYELQHLMYDRSTNKVDHPHNPNANEPIYFKDCADALAGATIGLYLREHIQYEEAIIEKETEKLDIPDDGFFSTLSHVYEEEDVDEIVEFQNNLYGEESDFVLMDDL